MTSFHAAKTVKLRCQTKPQLAKYTKYTLILHSSRLKFTNEQHLASNSKMTEKRARSDPIQSSVLTRLQKRKEQYAVYYRKHRTENVSADLR